MWAAEDVLRRYQQIRSGPIKILASTLLAVTLKMAGGACHERFVLVDAEPNAADRAVFSAVAWGSAG